MTMNGYVICQRCQRLTEPTEEWARTGKCPECGNNKEKKRPRKEAR